MDRAGGDPDRLWVDDSKAILHGGRGRERLELCALAALDAVGLAVPRGPAELMAAISGGATEETELARWTSGSQSEGSWPAPKLSAELARLSNLKPLEPRDRDWRLVAVRAVVLGPERFNARLATMSSKATVHFSVFRELIAFAWELAADGQPTEVLGDKHGGRHYYLGPLSEAFSDTWIDRGPEGPELSRYTVRDRDRTLSLSLTPRADAASGLVALASIISKTVRELWMDRFNAFWTGQLEGLRPTAGYPVDAARYRREIEPLARSRGLDPDLWWRRK